jgi:hypothetical protein
MFRAVKKHIRIATLPLAILVPKLVVWLVDGIANNWATDQLTALAKSPSGLAAMVWLIAITVAHPLTAFVICGVVAILGIEIYEAVRRQWGRPQPELKFETTDGSEAFINLENFGDPFTLLASARVVNGSLPHMTLPPEYYFMPREVLGGRGPSGFMVATTVVSGGKCKIKVRGEHDGTGPSVKAEYAVQPGAWIDISWTFQQEVNKRLYRVATTATRVTLTDLAGNLNIELRDGTTPKPSTANVEGRPQHDKTLSLGDISATSTPTATSNVANRREPKVVPRLDVDAHLLAKSFNTGAVLHGIEWNEAWLPVLFNVINHGPVAAYELELSFWTSEWIVAVQQSSGPSGLELKVGDGTIGPEAMVQFDDGSFGAVEKSIAKAGRLYLPRLSGNDRLGIVMAIAQPQNAKTRDEAIERLALGYRGTFASVLGSMERHPLVGDVVPIKPSIFGMATLPPSQGA